nr:FN3 associated domain-containing protein [Lysinibacillus sp. SGAir0095]
MEETEQETDLIISQYIEGGSFNKALELYNNTNETLDLSQYSLELYADGKADNPKSITLAGTLEAGKTIVLYHKDANVDIKSLAGTNGIENSSVINFNGNDPVVLKKNGEIIDSLGQIGSSTDFAKDVTLVRNESIKTGDKNPNDVFSFETEWTNLGKDVFDNLGKHPYIPEQLQTISMAEARTLGTGEVQIQGVVTAKLKNTIHIQDETGAMALYGLAENVNIGDEIVVKGKLSEYNGLLQLQSPALVESVGTKEVTPTELAGADLKEENESKLASVTKVTITKNNGSGNYEAKDEVGTVFIVRDENSVLGLEIGKTYDSITGIIQEYNGAFQIIPRGIEDVVEDASKVRTITASTTSTSIPTGTAVELSTLTDEATIYYTTDGTEPTVENGMEYTAPIVITEKTTLKAIAVKEGLSNSDVFSISYDVYDGVVSISDIQGEGHTSPMDGTTVEGVEGIITSVYELNNQQYFHMQTPDSKADNVSSTSEGIVVYAGSASGNYTFKVGDLVSVSGVVDEYRIDGYADADTDLTVTQLNAKNGSIQVLEENVELPTPIVITSNDIPTEIDTNGFDVFTPSTDAMDYWESLEGMRVQIGTDATSKLRVVSPEEYGEIITVFDEVQATTLNGGLLLGENDANGERIQFKLFNGEKEVTNGGNINTGDYVNAPVVGFVNYGYSNFKVYVDQSSFATTKGATTKETTSIEKAEGKLTIASYNLENFSATSNATKVRNIAEAFVDGLNSPDIIGVTEMQDNDGATASGDSSADQSYQKLIEAIIAAGGPTYEYVNIDPEYNQDGGAPGGNIRVGFLYNPAKVSLPEGSITGSANNGTEYVDGKLTLNPGRINPTSSAFNSSRKPLAAEFNFNGEQVIVVVNHWNSKGGDSPLFGTEQPAVLGSEVQRKEIAQIVRGFVETIQTANPDANIVAVGDFNDFQWTPALQIFEGENESMVNMINTLPENDRYSYTYQGNSQALDHIFVSDNLKAKSILDILHVNADFTEEAGRASDHDPLMVQIDFTK